MIGRKIKLIFSWTKSTLHGNWKSKNFPFQIWNVRGRHDNFRFYKRKCKRNNLLKLSEAMKRKIQKASDLSTFAWVVLRCFSKKQTCAISVSLSGNVDFVHVSIIFLTVLVSANRHSTKSKFNAELIKWHSPKDRAKKTLIIRRNAKNPSAKRTRINCHPIYVFSRNFPFV